MSREQIMDEPPVVKTKDDARSGETPHIVRYVLGISLVLAIVTIGALVYLRSF
jgi:hypothetical protein